MVFQPFSFINASQQKQLVMTTCAPVILIICVLWQAVYEDNKITIWFMMTLWFLF